MVELNHPAVSSEPLSPIENKLTTVINNNNINNMSNTADNNNDPPPSPPPGGGDDGGDSNGGEVDQESNKRSERKRRREKQRRSDLSNAFDELAAFIVQVEPSNTDEGGTDKKGKKRKSSDGGGEDSSGITRLDLIGRALRIMKRLYRENEERKRVIVSYDGRGGVGGGNNDNVSEVNLIAVTELSCTIYLTTS
jgi:hypothetical protein